MCSVICAWFAVEYIVCSADECRLKIVGDSDISLGFGQEVIRKHQGGTSRKSRTIHYICRYQQDDTNVHKGI